MTQRTPAARLASVDVFRGATMAAMVIVNTPGSWSHMYAPLRHAEWHGWTPTDLIFPFFVFIVGVAIVLSERSLGSPVGIAKRAIVLYLLGLLLALYPTFNFATVRLVGVLARLAACYFVAAVLYRSLAEWDERRRLWTTLGIAGALLVIYWALLMWVPAPGGVAGDLTPSGNLGAWIDRTLIGEAHLWRSSRTWDPEGLLSTLPAIATALTGVAAGIVLRGGVVKGKAVVLLLSGAVAVLLGLLWDLAFPINKNLWTSSYVLFTSGLAAIALTAGHVLVDRQDRGRHPLVRPFVVLGRNALVLFVLSGFLVKTLSLIKLARVDGSAVSLYAWLFERGFATWLTPKTASLLYSLVALVVLYGVLEVLHRRRLYLRA